MIRNLVDQIRDDLKRRVLGGELQKGQRVYEDQIALELGVSRGVVREAVRFLEQEQLVQRTPHRGLFVVDPPVEEVLDTIRLRALMEAWAARIGGPATSRELERLTRVAREMEKAAVAEDRLRAVTLDLQFHGCIAALGRNRVLEQKHGELDGVVAIYCHSAMEKIGAGLRSGSQHRQMIEQLRLPDPDGFARTVEEHYAALLHPAAATAD